MFHDSYFLMDRQKWFRWKCHWALWRSHERTAQVYIMHLFHHKSIRFRVKRETHVWYFRHRELLQSTDNMKFSPFFWAKSQRNLTSQGFWVENRQKTSRSIFSGLKGWRIEKGEGFPEKRNHLSTLKSNGVRMICTSNRETDPLLTESNEAKDTKEWNLKQDKTRIQKRGAKDYCSIKSLLHSISLCEMMGSNESNGCRPSNHTPLSPLTTRIEKRVLTHKNRKRKSTLVNHTPSSNLKL